VAGSLFRPCRAAAVDSEPLHTAQLPALKQARPAAQYMLVGTVASTVTEPLVEDCTWVPVTTAAMDPEDVVVCCWVAA
jgi:hypothetical protein